MGNLVHPKEKGYFAICLAFSILVYLVLTISIIGLVYVAIAVPIVLVSQGLFIGRLRGNAIAVSTRQFPELHQLTADLARKMEMQAPAVYVLEAGGFLNAFATRFLGRDFVVLYSDVLEAAYEQGEPAVAFVVAHELAHIKRGHLKWRWAIYPGVLIPFLGSAYLRACEYTCDRMAAHYRPDGAVQGLLLVAAGKQLYQRMSAHEYARQADAGETGFWISFAEILQTHPHLPNRVRAVMASSAAAQAPATPRPARAQNVA
jgi:Zn-dependent protease with chaperone function